jgi:hypothetical protein
MFDDEDQEIIIKLIKQQKEIETLHVKTLNGDQ